MEEPGPSVIGSRSGARPGGTGGEPEPGLGQGAGGRLGRGVRGAGEESGLRSGMPRAGKAVIGRETPQGGRPNARPKAGPEADSEGVIRPSRRGQQSGGDGSVRQQGKRRDDERDVVHEAHDGDELWEVPEGVAAVIKPPAPYDAASERPGPHVGRSPGRRVEWRR